MRHQEVHQGPQLHEAILKWGAREQEAATSVEAEQGLPSLGLKVLDMMGFIQNHVSPWPLLKRHVILQQMLGKSVHITVKDKPEQQVYS